MKKNSVTTISRQKIEGSKIAMLTAYDFSTARLMDEAGVEILLVGDSLGMTMLGHKDTLPVTMEDMISATAAVSRGTENALVVADMPFMSYQSSVYDAVINAGRLMKEGMAGSVKLEGGVDFAPHIKAITEASIPVMAHIGLTPQSVNALGGFKVQGKDEESGIRLIEDALAVEKAGAFSVVLECVPAGLAALVTKMLKIPTIGIGAGADTDGQVLVYHDMLGLYGRKSPKFSKCFVDVGAQMKSGVSGYIEATKTGSFPAEEHCFSIEEDLLERLRDYADKKGEDKTG